jgi:epoxyqueuosine reductase
VQSGDSLADRLREAAVAQGLDGIGIAPAVTPVGYHRLLRWLDQKYHGEMSWMERRRETAEHPDSMLRGTRSVIVAAVNYYSSSPDSSIGRYSRYVHGVEDYHSVLKRRLKPLADLIREEFPHERTRIVVDSAPLLERDFAQLSGLGWIGKNTMLISRQLGSWFFLGAILTTAELPADTEHMQSFCGTCTRCLDACPTDAFPEAGVLDARRCISYLNIELREQMIPADLREGMGEWLFGCDVCQEVCPWNRFAPDTQISEFQPGETGGLLDARQLLRLTESEFARHFRGTPMQRSGVEVLRRNAAIVLGNLRDRSAEGDLLQALSDPFRQVRMASAWALCQLGEPHCLNAVQLAAEGEADREVAADMRRSLADASS